MTSQPLEVLIFQIIVVLFWGATLGSFSSALIYRARHHLSWIGTQKEGAARSACPHCHHRLGVKDLIPLISWLYQRGKCRYCKKPISVLYPILEGASMIGCVIIYAIWGFGISALLAMLVLPFLMAQIVLFIIDKRFSFQFCGIILGMGALALYL